MLAFSDYTQFFIAMLAIVDPVTILPLYLHLVRHFDAGERVRLARNAALTVTVALVVTVFIGQQVLYFFGISIGSFQIAGGLLLLIVALQLLYQKDEQLVVQQVVDKRAMASEVVVPLAIPLLAGPGAFSTVIVFSFRADDWRHDLILSGCLLALGGIVWVALHMSGKLMAFLSPLAISIINKMMGLIMAAIAVEFIVNGIKRLFLVSGAA